jgi:hypothetical protein
LKLRWKNRKKKLIDQGIMHALVKSIGLKPTSAVYNHERCYYNVIWKRSKDNERYFQIKVGASLFMRDDEDKKYLCVWCKFVHPEAASSSFIQCPIYSSGEASQLILECRQAIFMLRSEMD